MSPIARHIVDDQTELLRQVAPERREMTGFNHQHMVAGGKRIDDRGFPRASAAGRDK